MFRKSLTSLRTLYPKTTPVLNARIHHAKGDQDDWKEILYFSSDAKNKSTTTQSFTQLSMKDFMDKTQGKVTEENNRKLTQLFKQAQCKKVKSPAHIEPIYPPKPKP